jgi:hypothetical protein
MIFSLSSIVPVPKTVGMLVSTMFNRGTEYVGAPLPAAKAKSLFVAPV